MKKTIILGILIISFFLSADRASAALAPCTYGSPVPPIVLYNDLTVGSMGEEVMTLQNFLRATGYLNEGATGYFGSDTRNAVSLFQRTNCISPIAGYVGAVTRNAMANGLYKNTTLSNAPQISFTSSAGPRGSQVILYGSGFTPTGNSIYVDGSLMTPSPLNANGTTITFTVPSSLSLGFHRFAVSNSNGLSNSMNFVVTNSNTTGSPQINSLTPANAEAGAVVEIDATAQINNAILFPVLTDHTCTSQRLTITYSPTTGKARFTVPSTYPCANGPTSLVPASYIIQAMSPDWKLSNAVYFVFGSEGPQGAPTTPPAIKSTNPASDSNSQITPSSGPAKTTPSVTNEKVSSIINDLYNLLGQINNTNNAAAVTKAIDQLYEALQRVNR